MITKYNWHYNTPDLIWRQVCDKFLLSFSPADQRRIRKYIFQWLPTAERLHRQEKINTVPSDLNKCPSCLIVVETHCHFLQCQCHNRSIIKDTWFKGLKSFLENNRYTPPQVSQMIFNHLIDEIYPG